MFFRIWVVGMIVIFFGCLDDEIIFESLCNMFLDVEVVLEFR